LCRVFADDNDLREFDYERYLMEEVELRRIVDNPAMSMVSVIYYLFCVFSYIPVRLYEFCGQY